jgi:uncharacterized protein YegP (UPF0339 family)
VTGQGDEYTFNLTAANGEKILSGERYASHNGAVREVAAVKENAILDARYERREARDGITSGSTANLQSPSTHGRVHLFSRACLRSAVIRFQALPRMDGARAGRDGLSRSAER